MLAKHGYTRLVLLSKPNINFDIKEEWMTSDTAAIWLSLKRKGQKRINLGGIYREHRLLFQPDDISASDQAQISRWDIITNNWTKAGNRTQCFLLGDLNLDYMRWTDPDPSHVTMVDMIKNKLETKGFSQHIKGPTHFWPNRQDSLIDHVWANSPELIISVRNITNSIADHNVIELNVCLKGKCNTSKEIIRRVRTNFNLANYRRKISSINWEPFYSLTDVNLAYNFFHEKVVNILEEEAPMKKIQLNKKHKSWLSTSTRKLIEDRNFYREQARIKNCPISWNEYKIKRNFVTRECRKDTNYTMNFFLKIVIKQ